MTIGLLGVSISGRRLLDAERRLLAHPNVGSLTLFKENWSTEPASSDPKAELTALIQEIRTIKPELFIAVDHEGGAVWRFHEGFTHLPEARHFGRLFDEQGASVACQEAFTQAYQMAAELLDCGINASFAPVLDLDGPSRVIGLRGRAFHEDPEIVSQLATAFIKGMNKAGMPGILKHFPGHGSTELDSHITRPQDDRSLQALQNDLYPFRAVLSNPELWLAVMSNHVKYPALDPEHVAGYSEIWLKGCLRAGFGFCGPILSDCLSMAGADIGEIVERITLAQAAGNDLILVTHQHGENLDRLLAVLDRLADSAASADRRLALLDRNHRPSNTLLADWQPRLKPLGAKQNGPASRFNTHRSITEHD